MPMEPSDEEVMMDYQSGNESAFRELFHRYQRRILHFCHRLLGSRAEAEDAAADVFLVLVANRTGYRAGHKLSTWLYTLAHHKCVDRIRRRRWTVSLDGAPEDDEGGHLPLDPPSTEESVVEGLSREQVAGRVRQALAMLPSEQREAIILHQYQGCSYDEIGQILHCSLAKVKILMFRGKERLREELATFIQGERS